MTDNKKDKSDIFRFDENFEKRANAAFLLTDSPGLPESLGKTVSSNPTQVEQISRVATYATPSLADRGERIIRQEMGRYVTPEEQTAFTPAAVQQMNEAERRLAENVKAKKTGTFVRGTMGSPAFRERDIENYMAEKRSEQSVYRPAVESIKDPTARMAVVVENYPTLMAAADSAGLSPEELTEVVNFTLAYQAADIVGRAVSPARKAAILATMSQPMQALVTDIVNAGIEEQKNIQQQQTHQQRIKGATAGLYDEYKQFGIPVGLLAERVGKAVEQQKIIGEESTGNSLTDAFRTIWNWSLGPAIDAVSDANQGLQKVYRAAALTTGTGLGEYSWREAWAAAERGQFSEDRLNEIRQQYGAKPVDLILEIEKAKNNNDADFIGTLIKKYQNDPEMLDFIDQAINGIRNDQEMADLITSVLSAQTGDTGNIIAFANYDIGVPGIQYKPYENVPEYEQTKLYSIARNTGNVAGTIFLDPLMILGPIRGGMLAAKYGLGRLTLESKGYYTGAGVFKEPAVQRYFNTLGGQLDEVNKVEAADGVVASSQLLNSVRAVNKNRFNDEALNDMRQYLKTQDMKGKTYAAVFEEYFDNIENLQHIIKGQHARRGKNIQIPHMNAATARAKRFSLTARGITYSGVGASRYLNEIFGEGFAQSMPEDAAAALAKTLSGPDGDKYVGRALSDFLIRDGEMVRTLTGRIVLSKLPQSWGVTQRYGWRRKQSKDAIADRTRRLLAIWPDESTPLKVSDASDAERVQQLAQAAGMPRHFSLVLREIWQSTDERTRRIIGEGIGRSYAYARGVDVVSEEGRKLIDEMGPGVGRGDQYAASMPDIVTLQGQASTMASSRIKAMRAAGEENIPTRKELANQILREELLPSASKTNPSMYDGNAYAITLADTSEYMTFPQISRFENYTARSSLLTALTGQNIGISNATDVWVLGTLAGPRFQMRSGIEDMGLYLATGGSLLKYLLGRKFSTARREATARPVSKADEELRPMQLGLVKTLSRRVASFITDEQAAIILPNLSKQDLALANVLAKEGNREALARLVGKAYLRQRLRLLPGNKKIIGRTMDEADLSPDQLQQLRWLEQAVIHGDVLRSMDEAAETGRHLADGFAARANDMNDPMGIDLARNGDIVRVDGQDFLVTKITISYDDIPVTSNNSNSIKAWYHNIAKILHGDGPKGQWTMQALPAYFRAVSAGNTAKADEIIQKLAEKVSGAPASWGYGERFAMQKAGGYEALARASLDNAMQLFVTQNGRFNRVLFKKLQTKGVREDGTEFTKYALWDVDESGKKLHLVTQDDLLKMKAFPPVVNAPDTQTILTPSGQMSWTNRTWAAMGRSLARMTREPIFTANYLDAREVLLPFENRLIDILGKEGAEAWAVKAATERAFRITMDYVDNPAIRSQFAWQVRNVARFYRALEDFNRRMVRTTQNNPMALYKIALGWNVLDESGFVWEDEFGEKYFVWPGTRVAFEAVNGIMNMLGVGGSYSTGLPLAFTSRVNMLTPSADPNALLPTFSGPYSALAVLPLMRALPGLSALENEFFGEYTSDRSIFDAVFPVHVVRAMEAVRTLRNSDEAATNARLLETNTIFATAARSAAQAYAAAGLWDPSKVYSDREIADHRRRIDVIGQWIVGLKFILSPVAPAALSLNVDTATDYAKTLGIDGMRPAFIQVLKANNGDVDAATVQWIQTNPDLSPFIVSTTGTPDSKGYYGPFEETVRWIEDNEELVKLTPEGASFFAPQEGKQSLAAWNMLESSGYKIRDSVDVYLKNLYNAEGKTIYYILRKQWQEAKQNGDKSADGRWENAKKDLEAKYPGIQSFISGENSTGERSSKVDFEVEVNELRKAVNYLSGAGKLDKRGREIQEVVSLYDQASGRLSKLDPEAPNFENAKSDIRSKWKNVVESYSKRYPGDKSFDRVMYITTGALGFRLQ